MTPARLALLPLAVLGLSACAGSPPSGPIARYPAGEIAADAPLAALPPAAGRVVAVRRTDYANGVSEQVVLDGPRAMTGENRLTIAIVSAGAWTGPRDRTLDVAPPSDETVAADMLAELPDVRMAISADMERNADGPFGYATGMAGRLTCLYAWQYIAPKRPLSLIEGVSAPRPAVTSVRVRLCRDLPAATLLGYIRALSLARNDDVADAPAPAGGLSSGDALDAALGLKNIRAAPTEPPVVAALAPRRHLRFTRSAPRHRAVHRRVARSAPWPPGPAHHGREPEVASSGATRVPMPDQVAAEAGGSRPEPTRAPGPGRSDPLPLPH